MAYFKQFINAGELISSLEINQIGDNIEQVRVNHKGATAAPGEIAGVLWIDDSTVPWKLKVYSGTEWLSIGTINPTEEQAHGVAQDHVTDNDTPVISETEFIVTSFITQDVWESIGPTGSGADNIWTALNSVPLNAEWVEIRQTSSISTNAALALQLQVYARTFSSSSIRGATNHILHIRQQIPGATNSSIFSETTAKIQVDSQNRFEINWDLTSGNAGSVRFFLTGYGFNR